MTLYSLFSVLKGGPRSGNRGHAGRLGKRGGSAPKSGGVPQNLKTLKEVKAYLNHTYKPEEIEEAVNRLSNLVKDCPVTMRVPEDVLIKILDDGKFKNQHETGTSGGLLKPAYRENAERNAFGEGLKEFPIYGYIATNKSSSSDAFTPITFTYGGVKIIFNDDIKSRTTITANDSLSAFYYKQATGSPLLNPNENSLDGDVGNFAGPDRPSAYYIEAQIHGGLTVKDIKKVVISRHSPRLEDSLRGEGIPFVVANSPGETEDTF